MMPIGYINFMGVQNQKHCLINCAGVPKSGNELFQLHENVMYWNDFEMYVNNDKLNFTTKKS